MIGHHTYDCQSESHGWDSGAWKLAGIYDHCSIPHSCDCHLHCFTLGFQRKINGDASNKITTCNHVTSCLKIMSLSDKVAGPNCGP